MLDPERRRKYTSQRPLSSCFVFMTSPSQNRRSFKFSPIVKVSPSSVEVIVVSVTTKAALSFFHVPRHFFGNASRSLRFSGIGSGKDTSEQLAKDAAARRRRKMRMVIKR